MPRSRLRDSAALLTLGVVLAVAGGWALWTESALAARGRIVAAWPTVDGEVIYSGVDQRLSPAQQRHGLWPFGASGGEHHAVVRYRYAVGGTPYLSDRLGPDTSSARGHRDVARAREEAARYPVGADVQVRFDPVDPGTAVLERDYRPSLWRTGGGGLAVLAGLICAGSGLWRRIRARGITS